MTRTSDLVLIGLGLLGMVALFTQILMTRP